MSQSHSEPAAFSQAAGIRPCKSGTATGDAATLIEIDSDLLVKYLSCQIDEIRKLNRRLETTNRGLLVENTFLKDRYRPAEQAASFLRRFRLLHRVARGVYVRVRGVAGKVKRRLRAARAA